MEMRDGVRLPANIYRPDARRRFPALLMRSPYGNGGAGSGEDIAPATDRRYLKITEIWSLLSEN
ncbi:MAG: hypothetical protein FVQ81_05870 [Candidatus Glassbacteria bacterium]|nr:hypothetical protein [Candidatus Glassbacteria bacterium]